VNTSNTYQTILGFGGAFTEAASYVFSTMSKSIQEQIIEMYWGPTGLHYTVGRIHMNSCDFCIASYSEDDTPNDFALITLIYLMTSSG